MAFPHSRSHSGVGTEIVLASVNGNNSKFVQMSSDIELNINEPHR